MSDLVQFLRDRLDEDFEAVQVVLGVNVMAAMRDGVPAPRWIPSPKNDVGIWDTNRQPRVKYAWPRERDHIIRHDPARVLAEVEAGRKAIEHYERVVAHARQDDAYVLAVGAVEVQLKIRALPYADHPDYRAEWRAGEDTT
jgi:hypothetical protein